MNTNGRRSQLRQPKPSAPLTSTKINKKNSTHANRSSSAIKNGGFLCQVCKKAFNTSSSLVKHLYTHSQERKHLCGSCNRAFKRADHLKSHRMTHLYLKPHACTVPECGKSYCDARSLKRHSENRHNETERYRSPRKTEKSATGNRTLGVVLTPPFGAIDNPSPSHICWKPDKSPVTITKPTKKSKTASPMSRNTSGLTPKRSTEEQEMWCDEYEGKRPARTLIFDNFFFNENSVIYKTRSCSPDSVDSLDSDDTPFEMSDDMKELLSDEIIQEALITIDEKIQQAQSTQQGSKNAGDQKPVECNLCHRKFKNVPALNGHMRLHGGYFKKDAESKKTEKKETSGPPLQTASVSVRALIGEKIYNKRAANTQPSTSAGLSDIAGPSNDAQVPIPPLADFPLAEDHGQTSSIDEQPSLEKKVRLNEILNRPVPDEFVEFSEYYYQLNQLNQNLPSGSIIGGQPDLIEEPVEFEIDDPRDRQDLDENPPHYLYNFYPTPPSSLDAESPSVSILSATSQQSPRSTNENHSDQCVFGTITFPETDEAGAVTEAILIPAELSPTAHKYINITPLASTSATHQNPATSTMFAYSTLLHLMPNSNDPLLSGYTNSTEFQMSLVPQERLNMNVAIVGPGGRKRVEITGLILEINGKYKAMQMSSNHKGAVTDGDQNIYIKDYDLKRASMILTSNPRHVFLNLVPSRAQSPEVDNHQHTNPDNGHPGPQANDSSAMPPPDTDEPGPSNSTRSHSHYTPAPMLKLLWSASGSFNCQVPNGSPCPKIYESNNKTPKINLGPNYQADVPDVCPEVPIDNEEQADKLWDPDVNNLLEDNSIRLFLELTNSATMPSGGHSAEQSLKVLSDNKGQIDEAIMYLLKVEHSDAPNLERWTSEEVEHFLTGLKLDKKDFFNISKLIGTKNTKQCVQFYYSWKTITKDYKCFMQSGTSEQGAPVASTSSGTPSTNHGMEGDYPCRICGKSFKKMKSRNAHMKCHAGERKSKPESHTQ